MNYLCSNQSEANPNTPTNQSSPLTVHHRAYGIESVMEYDAAAGGGGGGGGGGDGDGVDERIKNA